ncbi:hypothetical protein VNO77_11117 [Canavalia gladiata]|uniref:Uncharacterized protein n=1 Tax=Canavalia gladiata TaxID=3824 RepID=A0AAN9MHQ6_CANGL
MVCQAASQTRFRALKHENGSAGSSTIIVRVIACFQPLRECQAEYFPGQFTCFPCSRKKPFVTDSSCADILFLKVIVLIEWEKIVEPGHRICNLDGNHQI